tara:strand:+ start:4510 stop:5079 length:570 start_codon:yes stop_codon:yes gene_type:complete
MTEADKVKITRKQLRLILETAAKQKDKEAVFSIIYTSAYVQEYMEDLYNAIWSSFENRGEQDDYKIVNVLEDLTSMLTRPVMDLGSEYSLYTKELDAADDEGIEFEAGNAEKFDFEESVYLGIENINRFINEQTPMGMSALEALRHVKDRKINIGLIKRTTDFLLSLMDDDRVLSVLDQIDYEYQRMKM